MSLGRSNRKLRIMGVFNTPKNKDKKKNKGAPLEKGEEENYQANHKDVERRQREDHPFRATL